MLSTYPTTAYIHPLDKTMMDSIYRFKPLKAWLDTKFQNELDEVFGYVYATSFVRLPDDHVLYRAAEHASGMFGVRETPPLYVRREYGYDVECMGYNAPAIVLPSALLDRADEDILAARVYAQVASIAAEHHKVSFILWVMENMRGVIPLPFVEDALLGMLYEWSRCRIYTLDRALYLATDDLALTLRNILYGQVPQEVFGTFVFGKGDADTFMPQVERFLKKLDMVDTAASIYGFLQSTSWLPKRYDEVRRFAGR